MAQSLNKILIRGVNWIGDAVLTTPAVKAVRKAFPDANISLLVKPRVAEIFKGNPDINEIILYEDRFNSITGKLKLARILKSRGFNKAILLQNAFDAAFVAWLSGIPERIGYRRDWRRLLLTKPVPVYPVRKQSQGFFSRGVEKNPLKQHHVYYYLNLLKESLNIFPEEVETYIYLEEEEIKQAKNLLRQSLSLNSKSHIVGINPGATYGSAKRWMPERFAKLIQKIVSKLDAEVIIFGDKAEIEIANEILSHFPSQPPRLLNLAGKTGLRQLIALIHECDALITNDSGPMHIASALLVPVVAIFGSTDRAATGPFGEGHNVVSKDIPCSPCLKSECPEGHLNCMKEITEEDVFGTLQKTLPKGKAVFLDRDGTLNEDTGYLNSFSNLKIFQDVRESLKRLKKAGFRLIGITNQSGIARGLISEEFVRAANAYLQKNLVMDDFYFCPHLPDNGCQCRKPKPLLPHKARLKYGINLKASYVIGDKTLDMLLAKAIGAKAILVLTGHDRESKEADFTAKNLTEAVDWILKQEKL